MPPTSYPCTRCGMASPTDAVRCASCGARRRALPTVVTPNRTGPAAADAWERARAAAPAPAPRDGSSASSRPSTRPVGPGAVLAWRALRLLAVLAVVAAGVEVGRVVLAAAVHDEARLVVERSWLVLADLASVVFVALAAGAVIAVLLVLAWVPAAIDNLRSLDLDRHRFRSVVDQAALRTGLVVAAAALWWWVPNGPERLDRTIDLALGALTAGGVVVAAGAVQRLLVTVTATELQRAEWLLRVDAATAPRPRGRSTSSVAS